MKFVSVRDFRNRTAAIRKALETEQEMVLTANGKPFAILAGVNEDSFEQRLAALRRARNRALLDELRAEAKAHGVDKMTMEEIDEVIARARRERHAAR